MMKRLKLDDVLEQVLASDNESEDGGDSDHSSAFETEESSEDENEQQ
jgi:hypothetical protein